MSLAGNLRTMPLPDILQWLSTGHKSGALHIEGRTIEKRIVFSAGLIATSWSNDPREYLGQFLMRDRLVTEEQLFKALLRQEEQGQLIGAILMAEGVISEAQLRHALEEKVRETIYDLFLWPEGNFDFKEGEAAGDIRVKTEMGVTEVVLEGIRRVDEWLQIRAVLPPSTRSTFKVKGAPHVEDPTERRLLGLVASGRSLAEISLEMHRSDFETASLMFRLHKRSIIEVDKAGAEISPQDTVAAIKSHLARASENIRTHRFDEAMEAYEEVLALDRLNQHAKKGLISVAEARSKERAVKRVPLEGIPELLVDFVALTKEKLDPQEGFVLSRINGDWDIQSILKLCPIPEEDALLIFSRLLERKLIGLKPARTRPA